MEGTLHTTQDGRFALRFERVFAHPCAKLWRAITEADQLRGWDFPAVVDLTQAAGTKVTFASPGDRFPPTDGVIMITEPPTLLEYTWGDEILRWELEDLGDGCCRAARLNDQDVDWSAWDRADELNDDHARSLG